MLKELIVRSPRSLTFAVTIVILGTSCGGGSSKGEDTGGNGGNVGGDGGETSSGGAAGNDGGHGGITTSGGSGGTSLNKGGTGGAQNSGGTSGVDAGAPDAAATMGGTNGGSLPMGNIFVAVGGNSRRVSSTDGKTWGNEATATGPFEDLLTGVAFGNGAVVAAGHAGVFRSTDGKTWEQIKNLDGGQNYTSLGAVAFDHGMFVAIGGSTAWRSTDGGKTWKSTTETGDATHWRLAAGGGHFVAAGDKNGPGVRKTSEDGVVWHDYTDKVFSLNHIAFGGGRFLAVGSDGKQCMTSVDGKTWENSDPLTGLGGFPQVAYGDGRFLVCSGRCKTTTDGKTWSAAQSVGPVPNAFAFGVVEGKGLWVGAGSNYFTSTDGMMWTKGAAGSSGIERIMFGQLP